MADRIKYGISVTPIETLTDDNSNEHDIIASDVSKTLGCSGIAASVTYGNTSSVQGYNAGSPYYLDVPDGTSVALSTEISAKFVFIKNTGKEFNTTSALGDDFAYSIEVKIGTTLIAILDAGEGIVLKDDNGGINASNINLKTVTTAGAPASAGDLAAEFLVVG